MSRVRGSLQARLVLGTAAATAGILVAAGLAVYGFVRASLLSEFDTALASAARGLATMTEQDRGRVKIEPEAATLPEFARADAADHFAAWLDDGRLLGSSAPPGGQPLPRPSAPAGAAPVYSFTALPDGARGRQVTLTYAPRQEDEDRPPAALPRTVTLTVARHTAGLDAKLGQLGLLLAGVGAAATAAAALVMLLVVRRGLRPLAALAGRISTIGRDNLGDRVELSDSPNELTSVVHRLNELLDRVQAAVSRERRFTADVAHELRTPLAGLEATLDVCATRRRAPEEYERTLDRCGRIVRDMHVMVDNLLTLARADARQLAVAVAPVPLAALVRDCWAAFEPAAAGRGLLAAFDVDPGLVVATDADMLRIVVNNLLDNAVRHADAGGWLRVEARPAEGDGKIGRAELCVSNGGCTLTAEQAGRVFDRFWRGDGARADAGLHCGLGLSLCREIVALLSGRIEATAGPGGLFRVRVSLPHAGRDAPRAADDDAGHEVPVRTGRAGTAGPANLSRP